MSFRDSPEFKVAQQRMKERSTASHERFKADLLQAQSEQALNSEVVDTLTVEEFINRLLPEGLNSDQARDGVGDEDRSENQQG